VRRSDIRTTSSRWISRHWRAAPLAALARGADSYLRAYNNKDHAHEHNGEGRVLRLVAARNPRMMIDAGANVGDWTALALASSPSVQVHAFEASPAVAAELGQRFQSEPRATIVPAALGAAPGTATLHVNERISSVTSFVPSPDSPTTPVEVTVQQGDRYLAAVGIEHVDYLKVDVEGFDFEVLQGFAGALAGQAVAALQFEYNEWSLLNRHLLADFYDLLDPLGYAVGKIHPDGVDFRAYRMTDENWIGPSCAAVHRSHEELMQELALQR
jgi:FkbM family methyltransferase